MRDFENIVCRLMFFLTIENWEEKTRLENNQSRIFYLQLFIIELLSLYLSLPFNFKMPNPSIWFWVSTYLDMDGQRERYSLYIWDTESFHTTVVCIWRIFIFIPPFGLVEFCFILVCSVISNFDLRTSYWIVIYLSHGFVSLTQIIS